MANSFSHLDNKDVSKESIENFGSKIEFVSKPNLKIVKNMFLKHAENSDPEVSYAANIIVAKIDNIIWLWKNMVSWEIMEAANNTKYDRDYRSFKKLENVA